MLRLKKQQYNERLKHQRLKMQFMKLKYVQVLVENYTRGRCRYKKIWSIEQTQS